MIFGKKQKDPLTTLKKDAGKAQPPKIGGVGTAQGAPININYAPDGDKNLPLNYEQRDAVALPWEPEKCHSYDDVNKLKTALRERFLRELGYAGITPDSVEIGTEYRRGWVPDEKPTVVAVDFCTRDGETLYNGRFTGATYIEYREVDGKIVVLMDACTEYLNGIGVLVSKQVEKIANRKEAEADEPALIVEAKWALHKLREAYAENSVSHVILEAQVMRHPDDDGNCEAERRIAKVTDAFRTFCTVLDGLSHNNTNVENLWNIRKAGESLNREYMIRVV